MLLSKTFGQQEAADRQVPGINRTSPRLQIRQAMVGRWFFMIIGTIFSILPAFVYWLAGTMAAAGNPDAPTAGAIVAFTTLQSRLFFPLGQLLNVQVEIQGSLALFDRIFEYLDTDPEIVDAPDAVAMDHALDARQGPLPRRELPVPDRGGPLHPGARTLRVTPSANRSRTSSRRRCSPRGCCRRPSREHIGHGGGSVERSCHTFASALAKESSMRMRSWRSATKAAADPCAV